MTRSISVVETLGAGRKKEPLTMGFPFRRGDVCDASGIGVCDEEGRRIPAQVGVMDRWPDGSVRWALLDFFASVPPHGERKYKVTIDASKTADPIPNIPIRQLGKQMEIDAGGVRFLLDKERFRPISDVISPGGVSNVVSASAIILRDDLGVAYEPVIEKIDIEEDGPLRVTLRFQGEFRPGKIGNSEAFCQFIGRLSFFRGQSMAKLEFTIRNPRAAEHPGGMWDLGDRGSVFIKDLSMSIALDSGRNAISRWKGSPGVPWNRAMDGVEIYQDSSGGTNWDSTNHVNRHGRISTSFCGYRVYEGAEIILEGRRAEPVVGLESQDGSITAGVPWFWQNFPKSISAKDGVISIGLFPDRCRELHELQGGEQKTHLIFLSFSDGTGEDAALDWIHDPLLPVIDPEYLSGTGVVPYLVPQERDSNDLCSSLVSEAIKGNGSFFSRREIIDEYGWRNFGDLYADHERLYYQGPKLPVSHYNNQYDPICGAILQFARSGLRDWFRLAKEMALHVMDIDIYHTICDKPAFNGGLFWHTDHYADAATATHRTYSRETKKVKRIKRYGGGPSNEHLYTTGLLYFHYLTGNIHAKDTVIGLADSVIAMEDGSRSPFRFLCRGETGLASKTVDAAYHGPGRGGGNSINALMDAYRATRDNKYLGFAEHLIRRCIHPLDDIPSRNLLDHEKRWSYTVFLQILGKYLDLKVETGAMDRMFFYARESLLRHAEWMSEEEIPFRQCLDRVEYPTETWIVHDLRKSNVFEFAAKYSLGEKREKFLRKGDFFYSTCFKDLMEFETRTLTRPLVMMMHYGGMHSFFQNHPEVVVDCPSEGFDFGSPEVFHPQRAIAIRRAKYFAAVGLILSIALVIRSIVA